jgi:hypothetical protein
MEAVPLHAGDPSKRTVTRALRYALFVSVALAAVLLAMLAVASGNDRLLESHYGLLLGLNVAIGTGAAMMIAAWLWARPQRQHMSRLLNETGSGGRDRA